jgi:dihydroxyacetone kinase-like protein
MESIRKGDLASLFKAWSEAMAARKNELIALDSVMGDGDLGLTMTAAFAAAASDVAAAPEPDVGTTVMKAGMAMAKAAPSTMGTLVGTGYMRGGKALKGAEEIGPVQAAQFLRAFADGLMDRGKSKPGEKTIVDALCPGAEAAEAAAAAGKNLAETLESAATAAAEGLERTKSMIAQHGRAAYYQEKSRDKQDPGATVGSLVVRVFADFAKRGTA